MAASRTLASAGFWLGFALSGFFDGILLHQILQWHHLLSAVRGEDLRFQVLADGYFHLLMYAIAAFGLWLLWRARTAFDAPGASRRLLAFLLIGFGAWHFLDAIASHWVLGIHRIRTDAGDPLAWDLGWLALFGALPLAIGLWLRRGGPPERARRNGVAASLAFAVLVAGAWSSRPPPGESFTTIVFAPAVSQGDAFAAAAAAGGAIVWFADGVFVVEAVDRQAALALYRNGALLVTGAGAPASCIDWSAGV